MTAVIAFANRGGEQNLRRLESRFLDAGIIVARSASDLSRYHGKYILIDRRELYVLSFNFTHLDIGHSRGFGVVTTNPNWIREAVRLFEADCTHTPYVPAKRTDTFVVSPTNSRKVLGAFLQGAKTQLLIYDPKISDPEMLRILHDRAKAGVEIKIIGTVAGRAGFDVQKLDGHAAPHAHDHPRPASGLRRQPEPSPGGAGFTPRGRPDCPRCAGRQEAHRHLRRRLDLDERRGRRWPRPERRDSPRLQPAAAPETVVVSDKDAQKAVQILTKELDPLAVSVKKAVRVAVAKVGDAVLGDKDVKDTMKKVVKKAVKDAVKEAVKDAVSDADAVRTET